MQVEIRCCCDPGKLLGYVEVDRTFIYEGLTLNFFLCPVASLKPFWSQRDGDLLSYTSSEQLQLPVAMVSGHDRSGEWIHGLALKSNDTPIEQLRRIRSFREAE